MREDLQTAVVDELTRRLTRLEDLQAVSDLYVTYGWLQDTEQLDELVIQIFTEDAHLDLGVGMPAQHGRAQIRGHLAIRGELEGSAHYFTNVTATVDGVEATARAYFQSFHWTRETAHGGERRPVDFVGVGVYLDNLKRTPEGWRISHRRRRNLGPGPLGHGAVPAGFARHLRGWGGAVER